MTNKTATKIERSLPRGAFLLALPFLVINVTQLALGEQEKGKKAPAPAATPSSQRTPAQHDGQHDFDFEIGTSKTHLWSLRHPLTDSNEWVESNGLVVVRKVWNGRANLVELVAEGPTGHFEFLNLRLYNPQTHQWSDYFANSGDGTLAKPMIGEFKNGRGEFFFQEKLNGRAMFFRSVISDITPDSCRFEIAFSDDGGKTWKVKDIAIDTRVKDEADKTPPVRVPSRADSGHAKTETQAPSTEHDGQHDFDFEAGTWKIHLKRLLHPLTDSKGWVEFDGTSVTRKIWNGRAWLEEFETQGPTGHIEGLTLRLYNPKTRQWSLYWANSKDGTMGGPPNVGEFKDGRGEFFAQDTFNGRVILIRYVWSDITPNSAHFEQSFSEDGGKTWEVNWITDQTRVKDEADKAH